MESKFTPGPWLVLPDLTVRVREWSRCAQMGDADGCIICDLRPALGVCDDDGERGQEAVDLARRVRAHAVGETDANARLIAAAPEMLATLRQALVSITNHARRHGDRDEFLSALAWVIGQRIQQATGEEGGVS